jgi:hypothetical protein
MLGWPVDYVMFIRRELSHVYVVVLSDPSLSHVPVLVLTAPSCWAGATCLNAVNCACQRYLLELSVTWLHWHTYVLCI